MITAGLVTYQNSESMIDKVLSSLTGDDTIDKVFVVDNSPNNQLGQVVGNYSLCEYIHNPENSGFGQAHNIIFEKVVECGSDYHFIVNPDIYFETNVISEMTNFLAMHPDVGISMPKVLYPDGNIQRLCKLYPSPIELIFRRFIPGGEIREKLDYKYEMKFFDYNHVAEIPILSGCFMCVRTDILKTGHRFDPRFFMYLEDFDFCRTVRDDGWSLKYNPNTIVYHEFAKGSHKNSKLLRYHIFSAIAYFNKWGWFFDKKRKDLNNKAIKGEL